jgi:hypothetical protein
MRKFLAAVLFALVAISGFAATSTEVPNDQVIATAKPLLGHFSAVVCSDPVVGLRFQITLRPNADKTVSPILTMVAAQYEDSTKPVEYVTKSFANVTNSDGSKYVGLAVTNGEALIRLRHSTPNARQIVVTDLDLRIEIGNEAALGYAIKEGDDPKDQWAYVKTLSMVCDNDAAQLQKATYTFTTGGGETDDQINKAVAKFNDFTAAHARDNGGNLDFATFGREEVGQPWFARLYSFSDDPKADPITWEEEGYPTAASAEAAIEKNYLTYPNGHSGKTPATAAVLAPVLTYALYTPETDKEFQAALEELNSFSADHNLTGGWRDGDKKGTYDVALFVNDADGEPIFTAPNGPKWVVYGATTLTEGVKQIESDYAQYPDGHDQPGSKI